MLTRGPLTLAVSTGGVAPALAALLREALALLVPADVEAWAREAVSLRRGWLAAGVPMSRRKPLLLDALVRLHGGAGSAQGREVGA